MLRRHVSRSIAFSLLFVICSWYAILVVKRQYVEPITSEDTQMRPPEMAIRTDSKDSDVDSVCSAYPDDGRIAVSVKTGATEVLHKLPAMLNTSLTCVQDVMVFSDLEQRLGDLQIHDALSRFSRAAMEANPDFDIYFKQRDLKAKSRENDIESLAALLAPERDWQTAGKVASWGLDKYKFIHVLEMAYELQPGRDWYVFVEADTYLSWPNLKRWLGDWDSTTKLYIGAAMQKSNRPPKYFAHGGAGFVLSGAAMKELAVDRKGAASRTDEHAYKWWAGDMMLADVLNKELSIEVTNAAPLFNHVDAETVASTKEHLSEPVITVHRITPGDFEAINRLERTEPSAKLLLKDVYSMVPSARQLLEGFSKTSAATQ